MIKCYHCHGEGHIKRNCPKRKKEFQEKGNIENTPSICEFGYDRVDALTTLEKYENKMWIMDLGCSYHMTLQRHWFQNY